MTGMSHNLDGFAAFYRATSTRTLRVLHRMTGGDRHIAADALQDAYVVLANAWPVRCERTFDDNRRYLVAIAANKVRDAYRALNRYADLNDEHEPAGEDPGIAAVLDELSAIRAIRDVIAGLPTRCRAVAVLYFLQDFGYREIASVLDIRESTVRTHVERARAVLQPHVDRFTELTREGRGHG
jgi:RNA polymerase sigma-70 factor (ECF subfamily)